MSIIVSPLQTAITQRITLTGPEVEELPVLSYLTGRDIRIESVHLSYTYDLDRNWWVGNDPVVMSLKYKTDGTPYNMQPSSATAYGTRRNDPKATVWTKLVDAHRPKTLLTLEVSP